MTALARARYARVMWGLDQRQLALAGVAVLVVLGLVLWRQREAPQAAPEPPEAAHERRAVAAPVLRSGAAPPPPHGASLGPRKLPPPPPDFHAGGEAPVARGGAERKLAAGELPLRPPGFTSDADRAKFRAWWLAEYARRTAVYRKHHDAATFPSDEDAARMMERLYDLGEPPRPGENAEDMDARQQAWFETWSDLTAAFGVPPKTIISFGGDPQYGAGPPPPVMPDGAKPLEPDETRPTMPEGEATPDSRPLGPAGPR